MDTDKLTITISGVQGRGVDVASAKRIEGTPQQVDLFQAADGDAIVPAVPHIESPAIPTQTLPEAGKTTAGALSPWDQATEPGKGLNFLPETLLHAKMNWVCNNVPRMSRLRILRDGAMAECDRLIALHYKG
jgi:hypothetical protein